jgi:hypothetical protein
MPATTPELIAELRNGSHNVFCLSIQGSPAPCNCYLRNRMLAANLIESQAAEIARLEAQVAQLQGERAATAADWRLIRSRGYEALASERDFTGHIDDGRRTAYYEGFKLGRTAPAPAPVQVSGVKLEPTADDSSSLGAATQPEGETPQPSNSGSEL